MDYKKIDESQIEIIPGKTPVKKVLETIARVSYELARPVGMGFFQPFETKIEDVDLSQFINLKGSRFEPVLEMDYVNGRQCKTYISRNEEGKLIFHVRAYEIDRGPAEPFLDKVKSALKRKVRGVETAEQSDKPLYWDRVEVAAAKYGIEIDHKKARESRLKVALALDKDGRENEAIEIMRGRDFDPRGIDGLLLLIYKTGRDTPEKFYSGFANIDRT